MHKKMGEKKRQQGQKHFLDISSLMCKAAPLTHPHVRSSRTRPTAASSSPLAPTTSDFKEMELAFMMRWSRTGRHLEPQQQESGSNETRTLTSFVIEGLFRRRGLGPITRRGMFRVLIVLGQERER